MLNQGCSSEGEARRRKHMKLHENLQLCLLALASRRPDSTMDSNEQERNSLRWEQS